MNKTNKDQQLNDEREYLIKVRTACGYLDLGMDEDAWKELDSLGPQLQLRMAVIQLRWHLLMRKKFFKAAARLAYAGLHIYPQQPIFLLLASQAYEGLRDFKHALETWECAPAPLRDTGFAHYYSARYAALLGRIELAREHLEQAISRDPKLSFTACSDRVLAPLIPSCQKKPGLNSEK